jgi:hypothetical protein
MGEAVMNFEIFCPQCTWRPAAEDRWRCAPGCDTVWNTFWTRGLCPGCGRQWEVTQCLECGQLSPHRHWYHAPAGSRRETRREHEIAAVK